MAEPSDKEKRELGCDAFRSFLWQFEPLDQRSLLFVEVLFEILMDKKYGFRLLSPKG
jgi:hypothetical protein